jgi:hypothetical protein
MNKTAMNEELRYLITKDKDLREELKWCKVRMTFLKNELVKSNREEDKTADRFCRYCGKSFDLKDYSHSQCGLE